MTTHRTTHHVAGTKEMIRGLWLAFQEGFAEPFRLVWRWTAYLFR